MAFGHALMPAGKTTALALFAPCESNEKRTNPDLLGKSPSKIHPLFSHGLVSLCPERLGRNTEGIQNRITAMLPDNEIESLTLAHSTAGVIALSEKSAGFRQNVRQLEHSIERALVLETTREIHLERLPEGPFDLEGFFTQMESSPVFQALRQAGGSPTSHTCQGTVAP
jgi:hypothetical protein